MTWEILYQATIVTFVTPCTAKTTLFEAVQGDARTVGVMHLRALPGGACTPTV